MYAQATIYWRGDEFQGHLRKHVANRVRMCLQEVENQVKRNISQPSRKLGPSKPGEFPHADTGKLRQSIFSQFDEKKLSGIVGTPLMYGLWLEYGTPGGKVIVPKNAKALRWIDTTGAVRFAKRVVQGPLQARSFLRRTLTEMTPRLRLIFAKPIPNMPDGAGKFVARVA